MIINLENLETRALSTYVDNFVVSRCLQLVLLDSTKGFLAGIFVERCTLIREQSQKPRGLGLSLTEGR